MKYFNLLISTRMMTFLLVLFAIVMGVATFIENDYGTPTAQVYIYKTRWFEGIMFLLLINFIGNIDRYNLLSRKKWATLLIHVSFIIILLGAFITRYFGYEGQLVIGEGETVNTIQSRDTFFKFLLNKETGDPLLKETPFILSPYHTDFNFDMVDETNTQNPNQAIFHFKVLSYIQAKYPTKTTSAVQIVTRDSMQGEAKNQILLRGQKIKVKTQLVGFESGDNSIMNIIEKEGKLYLKAPFEFISQNMMKQNEEKSYVANQEVPIEQVLYSTSEVKFMVMPNGIDNLIIGELSAGNEKKLVSFTGKEFEQSWSEPFTINGHSVRIGYGSSLNGAKYTLPFGIRLNDFQLEKYPGSDNPSSFASEVSVMDGKTSFPYRIFMNNVLDYKGFRFFQSSYQISPEGNESTVLSVNADFWGTWITYIGYFLMTIAMFLTLVWKGSHFDKLKKVMKQLINKTNGLTILFCMFSFSLFAQESSPMHQMIKRSAKIAPEHQERLKTLLVQDQQGRIKPLDTYARELIERIHGTNNFDSLSYIEAYMSLTMFTPKWYEKDILLVDGKKDGEEIVTLTSATLKDNKYYTSPLKLIQGNKDGKTLYQMYEKSFNKKDEDKTEFDKSIIRLVERISIFDGMNRGSYFWVVPDLESKNNDWNSWASHSGEDNQFFKKGQELISTYFNAVLKAQSTNNWKDADTKLEAIRTYQQKANPEYLLSKEQIQLELFSNSFPVFIICQIIYTLFGFLLIALAFMRLYKNTQLTEKIGRFLSIGLLIGFILHTIGILIRWYIAEHAPWSNAYEIIIFVAWATMLATLIFAKKNYFVTACGALMATLLMVFTFITDASPAVTNLMPVLKSYWLVVHVQIISSSYGFLGLSCIIGFTNLILMNLKKNNPAVSHMIKELSTISEMSLTIGLYVLSIGTFLGGVWANESWGRYWSWDPKETWAFISMIIYAAVAHMRLVPGLRGSLAFNLASVLAFSSILMTFIGVNYFLSGMHSYGKGDPIPILNWALPILTIVALLSIRAYRLNKVKS